MRNDIETSAPNLDEIRGGLGCFRSLIRDLEQPEALRELAIRFGYVGDCANRRIEIGRILREVAPPTRARFLADTAALAEVAFSATKDQSSDSYWNREALEDALLNLAQGQLRDRSEFKLLAEFEAAKMQASDAARMRRLFRDVAIGLGNSGIEQGESMRAARAELFDLVSDTAGERSGLGWLLMGWLCLWNSAYCADAVSHLSQGILIVGNAPSYLAHLLHRFLGMALEATGRHGEALEAARTAMAMRVSADLALEAARYAIQCGRVSESKQLFETAVRQEPMYLFVGLADPDTAGLESLAIAQYAAAGTQMRQGALRAIEEWNAVIERVRVSENCLGEVIEVPFELADGLDELRAIALKSDMLEAIGVRSAARRTSSDLYQFVLRRMNSVVSQREAEAATARGNVNDSVSKRQSITNDAEARAEKIIAETEAELRKLVGVNGAGAAMGTAFGGAFFMLIAYAVAAGVAGPHGIDTSFDSPFGMAGACLIAAPIVLGVGSSAANGLKQAALSSEIERRGAYAREKAKATLIEVEKSCKRQAEVNKATAIALDERARMAGEALKILRSAPSANEPMPEVRASKEAA